MSLARAGLRLATILALSRNFTAPYPTLAEDRVFDSRIDPMQGQTGRDAVPTLIVYTDEDTGEELSQNNGGPPFRRYVTLVIEMMIGTVEKHDEDEIYELFATDAETEALLDLFEHQVRFVFADITNPWSVLLLNDFMIRMHDWDSKRMMSSDGNLRWSARQVTARIEIRDDELPEAVPAEPAEQPLPENIQKLLDAVAADLDDGDNPKGHVKPVIDMLKASGVPSTVTLPMLKRIWLHQATPEHSPDVVVRIEDLDQN